MDGVIYHGDRLLPGAKKFVAWLKREAKHYLFLTNSSRYTPADLRRKMEGLGMEVEEPHFYTSAQATASFLASQLPRGKAYVIGDQALLESLAHAGIALSDARPDWVVVGETNAYNYQRIQRAVHLVRNGARLIGTNPDLTGPAERGIVPATGALIAPIELATGAKAYFVGKPNPLIMRHALKKLGCRREETAIIGDRMDTDIVAGIESEIETVLVLSGVTSAEDLKKFAYRPGYVIGGVGEIVP